MSFIRRNVSALVAGAVAAALTAGAPAVAGAVARYARNADKVDGKHAVGSWASANDRAGKIVATNRDGYLPNNIIKAARNSVRLNGFEARDLVRASYGESGGAMRDFDSHRFTKAHRKRVMLPTDGILMIWAQFSAESDEDSAPRTNAGIATRILVDGRAAGRAQFAELTAAGRSGAHTVGLSTAAAVAGGSHTVTLQIRRYSGRASAFIQSRRLQTLFVPFGEMGVQAGL